MRPRQLFLITLATATLPMSSTAQSWPGFANDPQHTALSSVAAQPLNRVLWSTPLVLSSPTKAQRRYIYWLPSPLVTPSGVVVNMIRTGDTNGCRIQGRELSTGTPIWTELTDYEMPTTATVSSPTLRSDDSLVFPGAGGTVYVRKSATQSNSDRFQDAFYGIDNYLKNPQSYAPLKIGTPLLTGPDGSIYFGYVGSANGISAGVARVTPGHGGTWISAVDATGDSAVTEPRRDAAPALSLDGKAIYAAFRASNSLGYLVKLDADTLQPLARVQLRGGRGENPYLPTNTASPMVGPDGDVYYGILGGYNSNRGWMLHYSSDLVPKGWPGPFGWDCTPSLVPASIVPSYTGTSKYLLLTKYNNYDQGIFRAGIFDPNDHEYDALAGTDVMKLVLVTPVYPQEWCINTAAIDPITKCAIMNNEDGWCYRWDFTTNTLSEKVQMTHPIGEAYTPTVIAPNGICLAIKNGTLFAMGR